MSNKFNEIKDSFVEAKEINEPVTFKFGKNEFSGFIQEIGDNYIIIKSDKAELNIKE
ncbi:hypothetical protein ES705_25331 [subsurface metagenome]